jgi:hypothetical protein
MSRTNARFSTPRTLSATILSGLLVLAAACGPAGQTLGEGEGGTLKVSCEGKCDGWGEITSLVRDPSKLDLGDLLAVGAGFATDGLNDALAVSDYGSISFATPKAYALRERAAGDLTLGNLDDLVTGLAAQFGERELTTEVNATRRAHLAGSSDTVFGECAFRIGGQLNHAWNLQVGGFEGGAATLGFGGSATLEARVISAYATEARALGGAPLRAVKEARGFVLPRRVADVQQMKPGESVGLHGDGALGVNVGAGVPILIANPTSAISYNLVLSAGLRAQIRGELDVQLVRLAGDQVVVDVGIEKGSVQSARVALEDGWGVQGLLKQKVTLGGVTVDLGSLVEKALQKQLTDKLNLISARAESTQQRMRLSVARVRFDLGGLTDGDPAAKALAQALRGDVRLAQALSNRGEPGVVAEFELSRSGVSSTSHAGIDLLGMSFFRTVVSSSGSVTIQTPGGVRTLMFDSLHREAGWFFSSHGYTRVGLSGLVFDPARPEEPTGEANFIFQVEEGDEFMEQDKLLDHLDAVILTVGGQAALTAIEGPANELERYVEANCTGTQAFAPCLKDILKSATVVQLRADGKLALQNATAHLDAPQRELVLAAGDLKLAAQATREPAAQFVGPDTGVVLDYRLDDAAMTELMTARTKYELRNATIAYLGVTEVDRAAGASAIAATRAGVESRNRGAIDAMASVFDEHAGRYQRLLAAERAVIQNLGKVGPRSLEIRFTLDQQSRPRYEEATAQSLAQARARTFTAMIDALIAAAQDFRPHPEQVVAYALMGMTAAPRLELRLDLDMDLSDGAAQSLEHYRLAGYQALDRYGRGSQVARIDGGLFNVDALIHLE